MSFGLGSLKTEHWRQLQDIAEHFEKAWDAVKGRGEAPALGEFLPAPGDVLRPVALHELIKTDLEIRWRNAQPARLEDYLQRFPELGPPDGLPVALVYEEYRVRTLYGDKPGLDAYQARFPRQFPELQKRIDELPVPESLASTVATRSQDSLLAALPTADNVLQVGGGYKLLRRIGEGAFGEVWMAEAPDGTPTAMKILTRSLDHEESKRELQSLDLIRDLRHPHLLETHDYWVLRDRLVVAMQLADGSLRDRLRECRQSGFAALPLPDLVRYTREAADALDYLHGHKVQHRDIKPENILLVDDHARVADFGLARRQKSMVLASASGSGTPSYMAPEVWRGKLSHHSDQYSLAATYGELRLGRRVFPGANLIEAMSAHLDRMPDLAPLPEAERHVLYRALAKEPTERYPDCRTFAAALEESLAGEIRRAKHLSLPQRTTLERNNALQPAVMAPVPARWKQADTGTGQHTRVWAVLAVLAVVIPLVAYGCIHLLRWAMRP